MCAPVPLATEAEALTLGELPYSAHLSTLLTFLVRPVPYPIYRRRLPSLDPWDTRPWPTTLLPAPLLGPERPPPSAPAVLRSRPQLPLSLPPSPTEAPSLPTTSRVIAPPAPAQPTAKRPTPLLPSPLPPSPPSCPAPLPLPCKARRPLVALLRLEMNRRAMEGPAP